MELVKINEKAKQECSAFLLIYGIMNMAMKDAETGRKERHQIEFVCMDELMPEVHLLDELSSVI